MGCAGHPMFVRGQLLECDRFTVAALSKGYRERKPEEAQKTARRMVAAWNAVRRIPTEALEGDCVEKLIRACGRLVTEFDAYDNAMAEIGRGHEDYGRQRDDARVALAYVRGEE